MAKQPFPPQQKKNPANEGVNGGGGNRTHGLFPADVPAAGLNLTVVGALLMGAVGASSLSRHYDTRVTARDYLHPREDELEARFVQDVLCRTTAEVEARWFGGSAFRYVGGLVDAREEAA